MLAVRQLTTHQSVIRGLEAVKGFSRTQRQFFDNFNS
jgi:hypothetical protein